MRNPVPHYYHCATKGFDHSILFADTREFIAGMNRIGICQARLQEEKVIVIAFCNLRVGAGNADCADTGRGSIETVPLSTKNGSMTLGKYTTPRT